MAKIYADTNRFLDFYRAAHDRINVLDELQKYKSSIVLTEQTIMEFRRNRISTLNQQVAQFERSMAVSGPPATSITKVLPGHKELTDLLRTYKKKGQEVLQHLKRLIDDEKNDPVALKFLTLAADTAVLNLKLTDRAVEKAHRRKLLGNPPRSQDKHTVGDEVIWELLLDGLKEEKEDLIIVTRDGTFSENLSLLSEEYERETGSKLRLVTEKFTEALKGAGQEPSRKLIEEEKKLLEKEEVKLPPDLRWVTKGSGRHAAALWRKVDDLIRDYAEEIELETGECISGDQRIVPIMRLLAAMIDRRCEEVDADIKRDFGMGTDEGS